MKNAYVYIITNDSNEVLYTGVTSDLVKRIYEHKNKFVDSFSKKYNLTKLVYYEVCDDIQTAITREKQIKGGSRQRKTKLIDEMNGAWIDLYDSIL